MENSDSSENRSDGSSTPLARSASTLFLPHVILILWAFRKVRLNCTGCMLTLIGAVQSTGGYCLSFLGSQIAALTMPKQETSIFF